MPPLDPHLPTCIRYSNIIKLDKVSKDFYSGYYDIIITLDIIVPPQDSTILFPPPLLYSGLI